MWSDLDWVQRIKSWARDMQLIRGVSDLSNDTTCMGVQALTPLGSWKKIWDKKKSPIWVYVSPSISQTNNKQWALSRIKWEIYFYKEMFRSFIEVVNHVWKYTTWGEPHHDTILSSRNLEVAYCTVGIHTGSSNIEISECL